MVGSAFALEQETAERKLMLFLARESRELTEIVYKKESYAIVGACFAVYNEIRTHCENSAPQGEDDFPGVCL